MLRVIWRVLLKKTPRFDTDPNSCVLLLGFEGEGSESEEKTRPALHGIGRLFLPRLRRRIGKAPDCGVHPALATWIEKMGPRHFLGHEGSVLLS